MTSIDPAGSLSLPRGPSDGREASCGGVDDEVIVSDEESAREDLTTALATEDPQQLIGRIPVLHRYNVSARPLLEKPSSSVSSHTTSPPFHAICTGATRHGHRDQMRR